MSDVVKWGLLVAGALILIGLIVSLPFVGFVNVDNLTEGLTTITTYAGTALYTARCFINNFLSPTGRVILSGLLFWFFGKFAITVSIKILAWVYHFIFK